MDLLTDALLKANEKNREEIVDTDYPTQTDDNVQQQKTLYFIQQYNPYSPPMKDIITKHWPILGRSNATKALIEGDITFGFSRPKNLRDHLCSAKLTPIRSVGTIQGRVVPDNDCNKPNNCSHCPRLNKTGRITSSSNGRTYKIPSNVTCQSNNLIYTLTCDICGIQYVGQTKNRIMDCFNGHKSDIRNNKDTTVARHMATHNATENPPITISIVHYIGASASSTLGAELRNKWERMWMARLCTYIPQGLNIQD